MSLHNKSHALLPGIYRGWVRHRRYSPKSHDFEYPLAMVMFDLNDLQDTFSKSPFWSQEGFNCIGFKRKHYIQSSSGENQDIRLAVADTIKAQTGEDFTGRILLLTHPSYFGFVMNPVSFYFCYTGEELVHIVSEINNTPWDERFTYVLSPDPDSPRGLKFEFDKKFHVSPFMPMDMQYCWRFSLQPNKINIHMTLMQDGEKAFDATMQGEQEAFTSKSMRMLPVTYPMQTLLVGIRIYWHALLLYAKGLKFFSHPDNASK